MLTFDFAKQGICLQPMQLFVIMVKELDKHRPNDVKWNDSLSVNDGVKFTFSIPPRNWKPGCFPQMVIANVETKSDDDDELGVFQYVDKVSIPTYGMYGQNSFYDMIEDVINEIFEHDKLAKQLFGEIGDEFQKN